MTTINAARVRPGYVKPRPKPATVRAEAVRVDPAPGISEYSEKPQRWPDLSEYSEKLETVRGILCSAYPKIWGAREKGRAIYEVFRMTGNGGWSRMLRTHDRAAAVDLYEKTGRDCYISMRDALTHELLGEMGRAPADIVDTLLSIYAQLEQVRDDERLGVKSRRWINGAERSLVASRPKRAMLEAQADVLARMVWLPSE